MRTILISILIIICFNIAYSQSSFEVVFEDPRTQNCWDIHECQDGDFYGVGYIGDKYQDSTHKGLIYKISRTGDTTTRTYHCGDTIMRFVKMIE